MDSVGELVVDCVVDILLFMEEVLFFWFEFVNRLWNFFFIDIVLFCVFWFILEFFFFSFIVLLILVLIVCNMDWINVVWNLKLVFL